jgi:predicted secreted Zn-dependent protease
VQRWSPQLASGVLALALALGGCSTALQTIFDPVVLKVERSTEYYDVRGVTSDEILEYLETHSLTDVQGRRLAGSTQSSWRLEWSALPGSASCYLQRLSILLKLIVTLPRHESVDSLPDEARANWDRLVTHIAAHEQRHVDIELESARKLERQIRDLPTASSCGELRFAIDAASKTRRAEARKAHQQFHIDDAARRRAEQEPIQALIDMNRGKLAIVESEIWGLDRILAHLGRQRTAAQSDLQAVETEIGAADALRVRCASQDSGGGSTETVCGRRAGLTAANNALALEQDEAVSRKARFQGESKELRSRIESLVEKYKFTW